MNLNELIFNRFKNWKEIFAIFIGFTIFLGLFQHLFLHYAVPNPVLLDYFIFKADSMSVANSYLSNFVNKNWYLFFPNILVMWIGLIFIFIGEKQKNIFWINIFFILILAPFVLSFFNIPVISLIEGHGSLGYSGIANLFLGYGFYSLLKFFYDTWMTSPKKAKFSKKNIYAAMLIIFLIPFISSVFFADISEFSLIMKYGLIEGLIQTFFQTKINIYIHIIAYLLGFAAALITHKSSINGCHPPVSNYSTLKFSSVMSYLICIVLSISMIWYLLIAIFYCETCSEKPLAYAFLVAFILIIGYASFGLFKMLFPARAELCKICSLIYRK